MIPRLDSGLAPPRGPDGRFAQKGPLVLASEGEGESAVPTTLRYLVDEVKAGALQAGPARRLLSLCKGALPWHARAHFPCADAIAMALVLAAIETGEVAVLRRGAAQVLNGSAAFRGRWIAFAALLAFTPGVDVVALAAALGVRGVPSQQIMAHLGGVRGVSWFSEASVVRVFVGLADDTEAFARARVRAVLAASDASEGRAA